MVNDRRILTCAHVVQDALEIDDKQKTDILSDTIKVDFPLSKQKELCSAQVIFWDIAKDIAVLQFISALPSEALPAKVQSFDQIQETKFRTFGFPNNYDSGVWAIGVIRGKNADGWFQLEDVKAQGYQIEPGFSGAPVWDDDRRRVVGMVVAADTDAQAKVAYCIPADALIAMLKKSGGVSLSENPYRGLEPFEAAHSQYFFGRTRMIKSLAEKVSKRDFVAVVGPSGSGKSSLIRAGLLPRLKNETLYADIVITPTKNPIDRLILSLLDWQNLYSLSDKLIEAKKISDLLQQDAATLQRFFMQVQQDKGQEKLLLVIDQFEELFTQVSDERTRRVFIDALIMISEEHFAKVVIAIRADFYGSLLVDPNLGPLVNESQHNILPLSRDELKEVIEQPAIMLGGKFEAGLVEIILQETMGQPGYLPLLEFALTQLWDKQSESGVLTLQSYEEIGRVAGAMANAADTVFEKYEQMNKANLVKQVFVRLVQPGLNAPDTRRRATKDELSAQDGGEIWNVVKDLADARLVVTNFDASTQDETVEISHEALIQGWSRLGEWVESDREFLTWRQSQLDPEIQKWESSQHDSGVLFRGASLVVAKAWVKERAIDLSDEEKEFIFESVLYSDDDYREVFPFYKPFEKAIQFIDKHLNSNDEALMLKTIKAIGYLDCLGDTEKENLVFEKLCNLASKEYSLTIRNQATTVLTETGKANLLGDRLSKTPASEDKKRIVSALAFARNIPQHGSQIEILLSDKNLRNDSRRIRWESFIQLIAQYRNELAIPLLVVFALGQIIAVIRPPLASMLNSVISNSTHIMPGDGTIVNYRVNLDIFILVIFLALSQYRFIRGVVIGKRSIANENRVVTALLAYFIFLPFLFLSNVIEALPALLSGRYFLDAMGMYFDRYPAYIYLAFKVGDFIPEVVILATLAVMLRFDLDNKKFPRQAILLAIISAGISAASTLLFVLFDIGPHPNMLVTDFVAWWRYFYNTSSMGLLLVFPSLLFNFLTIWICLLGFYFGLRVANFPSISELDGTQNIKINYKYWKIAFALIVVLFIVLSQYKSLLAFRCIMTNDGSAAVTFYDNIPMNLDNFQTYYIPSGTCLKVKAIENLPYGIEPVLHIETEGKVGEVYQSQVYWFANKESVPVVTPIPYTTSTPQPTWTPNPTSTLRPTFTPTLTPTP